jgi:hypothetical protein
MTKLLSANNNGEKDDPREFESLIDYVDVLIESFPKPITRKELAERTGVSKAAVTKIKNRLLKLCDKNALIFSGKLILQKDETYWKLFFVYFSLQRLPQFILSNYGLEIVKLFKVHSKISAQIREYPEYFSEKDTETMIRVFLHNLKNLPMVNEFKTNPVDPQLRVMLLSMNYMAALGTLFQGFDLPIETNEDSINMLIIRDKAFCFAKHMIVKRLKEVGIMSTLSEKEKTTYLEVYSGTVDFYLKRLLAVFTDLVEQVAKKKNLAFNEEFKVVGSLYKPTEMASAAISQQVEAPQIRE